MDAGALCGSCQSKNPIEHWDPCGDPPLLIGNYHFPACCLSSFLHITIKPSFSHLCIWWDNCSFCLSHRWALLQVFVASLQTSSNYLHASKKELPMDSNILVKQTKGDEGERIQTMKGSVSLPIQSLGEGQQQPGWASPSYYLQLCISGGPLSCTAACSSTVLPSDPASQYPQVSPRYECKIFKPWEDTLYQFSSDSPASSGSLQ